ncbi:hypothetical protein [Philodulcilactobacillus myokoensis]|nr:hypothetical protein [Philodulcilactobacillus myokoensis]
MNKYDQQVEEIKKQLIPLKDSNQIAKTSYFKNVELNDLKRNLNNNDVISGDDAKLIIKSIKHSNNPEYIMRSHDIDKSFQLNDHNEDSLYFKPSIVKNDFDNAISITYHNLFQIFNQNHVLKYDVVKRKLVPKIFTKNNQRFPTWQYVLAIILAIVFTMIRHWSFFGLFVIHGLEWIVSGFIILMFIVGTFSGSGNSSSNYNDSSSSNHRITDMFIGYEIFKHWKK